MTKLDRQVVVERPLADVLGFARDWRNIPRYLDYIRDIRPLAEYTEGLGARYSLDLTFLGRQMSTQWEVVAFDENRGWTFKGSLMGVEALKVWRFEPLDESTRVLFTMEYDPKPPVVAPLADALFIRRRWEQVYGRGLRNLKQLVESESH